MIVNSYNSKLYKTDAYYWVEMKHAFQHWTEMNNVNEPRDYNFTILINGNKILINNIGHALLLITPTSGCWDFVKQGQWLGLNRTGKVSMRS